MSGKFEQGQRALILDFGGVISRTLFETHALTEAALGLPSGTLTWQGPFDETGDTLWREMQEDRISERDYWTARTREVGRLVGEDWTHMETFVQRARGADVEQVIRPEAVAAIQAAKQAGCKLAILSNELDLFYGADFRNRLPLLQLFDVVVDATYTQILKPDPRAYQLCLAQLDLPPEACVFVDDQLRNVRGAQQLAIAAIHFDVKNPLQSFSSALRLLSVSPSRPLRSR
jgi:putative hydrolase of the HAD superfamily